MRALPRALVGLLILAAPVLSGCLDSLDGDSPGASTSKRGGATGSSTASTTKDAAEDEDASAAKRDPAGERWHFHNYWGLSPTYVVFEGNVSLEWVPGASCCPHRASVGAVTFSVPRGRLVPPETGRLDVNLSWSELPGMERLNVSYRPTGATTFVPHETVTNGNGTRIPVGEGMTDPPHASESGWAFRLEAEPGAAGVGVANGTIHVRVTAVIGRPVFIDPPHPDHWNGSVTVFLAHFDSPKTAAAGAGGRHAVVSPESGDAGEKDAMAVISPEAGNVVPYEAQVVLVRLAWTSDLPAAPVPLALAYHERNTGSGGVLTPDEEGEGYRVYRIPVETRMADPAYAAASGWTFQVSLEQGAGAFEGSFTLDAWVSRLPPTEASVPS